MNKFGFLLLIMLSLHFSVSAQVELEGKVNVTNAEQIYFSVFAEGSHRLYRLEKNGKFSCRLPRYEECIIAFYEKNSQPKTISINTEVGASSGIKLNLSLAAGKPKSNQKITVAPHKRYISNGSSYTPQSFDLDKVKDKTGYALLMSKVSKGLEKFYSTGSLPSQETSYSSNMTVAELRKSEHRLGQEIFLLLKKKKALETQVRDLNAKRNAELVSSFKECEQDFTILKKEASLKNVVHELAKKELDKEKMQARRLEEKGGTNTRDKVRKASQHMLNTRMQYEVAALNMKNKQSDCWEFKMQQEIDAKIQAGVAYDDPEILVKQLEISNVRFSKRLENAKELYQYHNRLANDLTDRDRLVSLANAQKYIAEKEELKLFQLENKLKAWRYKDGGTGKFDRQINGALKRVDRQWEIAYQAEMGYLEHMWHLRRHPVVEYKDIDNLYNRQSGLLAVYPFRKDPPKEDDISAVINDPEIPKPKASTEEILANVRVEETTDSRGAVKTVRMDDVDVYEIIEDKKGNRRYIKNGKPITKLTYVFETKRQFGRIIENVTIEDSKSTIWDLFKKKTGA